MPGEPIEGIHVVLVLGGTAGPWLLDAAVCGVCSAVISRADDGELRHLLDHEQGGQLGGSDPTD